MTKSEYEGKLLQLKQLREEVDKPRCINCEDFWEGQCRQHGSIPDEYVYQANQCGTFTHKIPF